MVDSNLEVRVGVLISEFFAICDGLAAVASGSIMRVGEKSCMFESGFHDAMGYRSMLELPDI